MSSSQNDIFERLGADGLTRVLDDLLDPARLTRLANSCGLKYPGMRTQSQKRQRILGDLAKLASEKETARRAIFRTLKKETQPAATKWAALSEDERERVLSDEPYLMSDGNLGRHLFLVAKTDGEAGTKSLRRLIGRSRPNRDSPGRSPTVSRAEQRLAKRNAELQKKVRRVEDQLAKSREDHRTAKRDLIKRKGELAESRMLAERVQRELSAAQSDIKAASERPSSVDGDPQIQKLAQAVRRLAGEQKKLVHEIAKVTRPEPTDTPRASDALLLASQAIKEMQKELARINRERKAERPERSQRFDELHAQLAALRKAVSKPARRKRTKGESARVGVFVDVQNVYYAARRLKGKLDFDALIETAVGRRRLIQATAYVVESKEIDQSGFIALLQQRGFEVRRKNLRVRADGSMKGDWDMELALDILDEAPHLDVVVLVSGDGDFTSLVGKVKRMGPRVEVIGFPRQTAKSLVEAADEFRPLDRKFIIRATKSRSRQTRQASHAIGPTKPPTDAGKAETTP